LQIYCEQCKTAENPICDYKFRFKLHRPPHYLEESKYFYKVENNWKPDIELSERISKAYRKQYEDQINKEDGQWSYINSKKLNIHEILLGDDYKKASEILSNPSGNSLLYGFDLIEDSLSSGEFFNCNVAVCWDAFIRLCEAWGVEKCCFPESYGFAEPPSYNHQLMLEKLNRVFSCIIKFPNPFRTEIGVKFEEGVASWRAIQSLHQAFTIYEKLGRKPGRVLEIGAGTGRTAYFASKLFGIDYTIIDLPLSCAASAYYLGRTLGSDAVVLYGESKESGIHILPPDSFLGNNNADFDLIVNFDSLTEMGYSTMCAYWSQIKKSTSAFLSVNHEFNEYSLRDIAFADTSIKSYTRMPYWLRMGYVEEYVTFESIKHRLVQARTEALRSYIGELQFQIGVIQTKYENLVIQNENIVSQNEETKKVNGELIQNLTQNIGELNTEISLRDNKINKLNDEANSLHQNINRFQIELNNILNSSSWKITKPFRNLSRILKR